MNNHKLKNYPSSLLKFFFERNTKSNRTLTNLGNVFRNSKWTDLKVQNTKKALTSQYALMLLGLFILPLLIWLVVGAIDLSLVKSYWLIRLGIYDWLRDVVFIFGLSASLVYSSVATYIRGYAPSLDNSINRQLPVPASVSGSLLNFSDDTEYVTPDLLLIKNSYELKNQLDLVNHSVTLNHLYVSDSSLINTHSLPFVDQLNMSLLSNKRYLSSNSDALQLEKTVRNNSLNLNGGMLRDLMYLNITPGELGLIFADTDTISVQSVAKDALHSAKQDRWLLKNSPVFRNLPDTSNSFLESKKLINSSIVSSEFSTDKLWNNTFIAANNNGSLLKQRNYSFIEDSYEFFTKRFIFMVDQSAVTTSRSFDLLPNNLVGRNSKAPYPTQTLFRDLESLEGVAFSHTGLIGQTINSDSLSPNTSITSASVDVLTSDLLPLYVRLYTTTSGYKESTYVNSALKVSK